MLVQCLTARSGGGHGGDLASPDSVGEAGAKVKRLDYFMPELGEGAEILEGSMEEIAEKLVELLKAKGGIK